MPILFPGKLYELLLYTCTMSRRVSHHTHLSLLKFPSSSFLPAPGAPQPLPCLQRPPTPCTLSAFRNGGIASDPCSTFQCPTGKLSGGGGPALCLAPIPYLQPRPNHPTLLEPILHPTPPVTSLSPLSLLSLTSFGMPPLCQAHWTFLVPGNI